MQGGGGVKATMLTDGSTLHETDRAAIRMTHCGAGCASHTCVGHLTVELAAVITADGESLLAEFDRCVFLVDCHDVRIVDTAFREHLTEWFKANRRRKIRVHMLVRSKVIALAATVANMLSGTQFVQLYSSIAVWQEACRRELADFHRQPLVWQPSRVHPPS